MVARPAAAERDPEQEHEPADDDADHADRYPDAIADALVEDVPRRQAEVGPHHEGHGGAEHREGHTNRGTRRHLGGREPAVSIRPKLRGTGRTPNSESAAADGALGVRRTVRPSSRAA